MNTKEIAEKLVELCRTNRNKEAYDTLYADEIICTEGDGGVTNGLVAVKEKSAQFQNSVDQFHGMQISDPIVAKDHFAITMVVDATYKGGYRYLLDEVCVFGVKNGKIITENYFFNAK